MKKGLCFMFLLIFSITFIGCNNVGAYDMEVRDTIIIGLEADYAPYNWSSSTLNDYSYPLHKRSDYADGYDVVIAKRIAEGLGKELIIKAIDWKGLIPAVKSGMVDLIIAGMTPTPEREKSILFTDEYYRAEPVIVLRKDSAYSSALCIEDFAGARVVSQMGTIYETLGDQLTGAIAKSSLKDYADLRLAIANKTADIMIAELPVAIGMCNKDSSLTYILFEEGQGFEVETKEVIVSIGMHLINIELRDLINDILASISFEERNQIMEDAIKRQ